MTSPTVEIVLQIAPVGQCAFNSIPKRGPVIWLYEVT
jgi:hypothetical protein